MRSATIHAEKIKELAKTFPWLYKIGAQRYYDKEFPRHIFIETTSECNLTCSYCPREKISKHMDFAIFKRIVDEASKFGPRSFSLHLFGEPLLWPHIIDGIKYIKRCNKRHVVLLTTNGVYLDRFADQLIEAGTDEIIWSWRKEAVFAKSLKDKLKKWGKFRVRLIKEITPKKAFEEWKTWPKVEVRELHNYGGSLGLKTKKPETRWKCYHLDFAPAISWNGDMLLCCSDPKKKEIVGNVKNQTISSMWQGELFKKVRESHMEGKYEGICKNCDVWKNYQNYEFGHEFPIRKN